MEAGGCDPPKASETLADHPTWSVGREVETPACHAGNDGCESRTLRHFVPLPPVVKAPTLNRMTVGAIPTRHTTLQSSLTLAEHLPFKENYGGSIPFGCTTWAWGNSIPPALGAGDSRGSTGRPDHFRSRRLPVRLPGPQPGEGGFNSPREHHLHWPEAETVRAPRCYRGGCGCKFPPGQPFTHVEPES